MAQPGAASPSTDAGPAHALRSMSLFAIAPPQPRTYQVHDLVQIIVRETSQAKSSQDLTTKKNFETSAEIGDWPNFNLTDLLNFQLQASANQNPPKLNVDFSKDFKGEGDYDRKDDLTARLTAEVVQVLPNGNLVLEARTMIKTDKETQSMKATGICRPADITAANTILSNQLHDLTIDKVHEGELRKANERGILAKILDTVFAF
jgi:flagellar L-ring protein precursor FlgH